MSKLQKIGAAVAVVLVVYFVGYQLIWKWGICHKWCSHGYSLLVTRKTGRLAPKDSYAGKGEQGVLEQMLGPGRHFRNPYTYSVVRVKDVVIEPGHIGTVLNKVGEEIAGAERFLAGPGQKGMRREVLTPGAHRINPHGQEIRPEKATMVKPGYVGVQTLREGKDKGVLDDVLPAGYYNINPYEYRIDEVEIGYRVWDLQVEYEGTDAAGRMKIKSGTGVTFPLADGKQMHLDMTVVWGLTPEKAPRIIRQYGTVAQVEQKIIEPQVLSICKNAGSNLTTKEFIEGTTRERFQQDVTDALRSKGEEKGVEFLIALVRGFHPDEEIKTAIQRRMLAEEEKITLKIEQDRDTVAAGLETALRAVEVAIKDFDAETTSLVEEERAQGMKKAAEVMAEADRKVAEIHKQAAEIDAQRIKITGQAEADVIEAKKKAEATRLQLFVDAFGGASIYNMATFAELLLESGVTIEYRYAGPGTLWTDSESKEKLQGLADKKILESATP